MNGIKLTWNSHERQLFLEEIKDNLWRNLRSLSERSSVKISITAQYGLKRDDAEFLAKTCYLISSEFKKFVLSLPKLRYELDHDLIYSTTHDKAVRGQINWSKTIIRRFQGDPFTFVITSSSSTFEIPENVELYNFLLDAKSDLKSIINFLSTKKKTDIILEFESYLAIIESFMAIPPMSTDVQKSKNAFSGLESMLLPRLALHRKSSYRALYDILQVKHHFNQIITRNFHCLIKIINLLKQKYGEGKYRLIQRGLNEPVAVFLSKKYIIRLFYQINPLNKYESHYIQIGKKAKINPSQTKPDIIIQLNSKIDKSRGTEYIVVELKHTIDLKYIRESLYKVLGYLYDFKRFNIRRMMLVVWKGVSNTNYDISESCKLIIVNWESFEDHMMKVFDLLCPQ